MFSCSNTGKMVCVFFITLQIIILPLTSTFADSGIYEKEISNLQKGMCISTWDKRGYNSPTVRDSLKKLKKMGVEFLQINVTRYQEKCNSTEIKKTNLTPSNSSVKKIIKLAHEMGFKVMLKPKIDLIDPYDGTYWRADIGFSEEKNWRKWFRAYTRFINHYARIAEKYSVEVFCVGSELSFTAQQTSRWKKIIQEVRNVYSGKLTYSANWDNYSNVDFWNELDYAGIAAYFPLTYKEEPSLEEIKAGWKKWQHKLDKWQGGIGRPVIFTEIGYTSTQFAATEPWQRPRGSADVKMQAKCYRAFFETIWESTWLAGVYWWHWTGSTKGGGRNSRGYTPLNKPSSKIIEQFYRKDKENWRKKVADYINEQLEKDPKAIEDQVFRSWENYRPRVFNIITGKAGANMTEAGSLYLLNAETLSPAMKTKHEAVFRKTWGNKKKQLLGKNR